MINYLVNIRTISTYYEVSFDLCPVIVAFPSHIVIIILDMIIPLFHFQYKDEEHVSYNTL